MALAEWRCRVCFRLLGKFDGPIRGEIRCPKCHALNSAAPPPATKDAPPAVPAK